MMLTLGIETSCDETSCAVLENSNGVRSNVVSSSLAKHQPFGGVVPEIASRHCLEAIDIVYSESLKRARIKPSQIDLVAVTQGPGLVGSLLVGVSFAKSLAFALGKPLIGVHHLEAHLASNFIFHKKPAEPFLGLIVSGGHTSLIRCTDGCYKELGSTTDDAIGEAYDKVAKILNLGYPGGPVIDRMAGQGNPKAFRFTNPKIDGRYRFSFSGVKTAVLHLVCGKTNAKHHPSGPANKNSNVFELNQVLKGNALNDLCASFQASVVDWIVEKTLLACEDLKIKTIVVGGGVSANSRLRAELTRACRSRAWKVFFPPIELTTDNALMIARLGYDLFRKGRRSGWELSADPNLKMHS